MASSRLPMLILSRCLTISSKPRTNLGMNSLISGCLFILSQLFIIDSSAIKNLSFSRTPVRIVLSFEGKETVSLHNKFSFVGLTKVISLCCELSKESNGTMGSSCNIDRLTEHLPTHFQRALIHDWGGIEFLPGVHLHPGPFFLVHHD